MALTRLWIALSCVLGACGFQHGALGGDASVTGDDDGGGTTIDIDAPMADAHVDAPPGQTCFGVGLLQLCFAPGSEPTGQYHPTGTIDTNMNGNCDRVIPQSNGPELCVKQANTVLIDSGVRYTGNRPIVLLAVTTITISNTLDVSAGGAGSQQGACNSGGNGGNDTGNGSSAGAGGGGGGGFGTGGGGGGAGRGAGGGGGGGSTALSVIRGGCKGGNGGNSSVGNGGAGGAGGGAVYLIAGGSINVSGAIKANGGKGRGGPQKAGGGGGGSGGLIAFDTPAITIPGTAFANGGGGGEGGDSNASGRDGNDPALYNQAAAGGAGGAVNGGNGGNGAFFTTAAQGGQNGNNGGGGAGGGNGRVKVFPTRALTGKISPPAT